MGQRHPTGVRYGKALSVDNVNVRERTWKVIATTPKSTSVETLTRPFKFPFALRQRRVESIIEESEKLSHRTSLVENEQLNGGTDWSLTKSTQIALRKYSSLFRTPLLPISTPNITDLYTPTETKTFLPPDGKLFREDNISEEQFRIVKDKLNSVVKQAVTFLVYEIEPLIVERCRKATKKNGGVTNSSSTDSPSYPDLANALMGILIDPSSESYLNLCQRLRDEEGEESYPAEFLETLRMLLDYVAPCVDGDPTARNKVAGRQPQHPVPAQSFQKLRTSVGGGVNKNNCGCTCFKGGGSTSGIDDEAKVNFGVEISYVDVESQTVKPYHDVVAMKRMKRRKSKLVDVKTAADIKVVERESIVPVLGDSSDRYVPMLSVNVRGHCTCERQMRRLQRLLELHPCVRDLALVKTTFDAPAKLRLAYAVEQCRSLISLDLHQSSIGNDGVMFLAGAFRRNTSIRILNLANCKLTGTSCRLLARALVDNRTLTDLDVGFNDIRDDGMPPLAVILQNTGSTLRRLKIRNNRITSAGLACIFDALRRNSRLSYLDASGNEAGDEATSCLSQVLLLNRSLRQLIVENCGISVDGCRALARPLKSNMSLKSLNLNMNPVGDGGLAFVADGLKYNRSLEELFMNTCGIGNGGLDCLLDGVRYNSSLKLVKMCYNDVDIAKDASSKVGDDVRKVNGCSTMRAAFSNCNVQSGSNLENLKVTSAKNRRNYRQSMNYSVAREPEFGMSKIHQKLLDVLHSKATLQILLWGN